MTAEVSHGRGGAGNIDVDDTKYVDGEVVRAGVEGSHGDGAYSSGRGGAGNIADVGAKPSSRKDADIIPEAAIRPSQEGRDFHTGRGGAGNEQKVEPDKKVEIKDVEKPTAAPQSSLADKLKSRLMAFFKR